MSNSDISDVRYPENLALLGYPKSGHVFDNYLYNVKSFVRRRLQDFSFNVFRMRSYLPFLPWTITIIITLRFKRKLSSKF